MLEEILKEIEKRYKKLGYNLLPIKIVVKEMYKYSSGEPAPFKMGFDNTTLFIDETAYKDLKNNPAAAYFYFAHELAHAASDEDHGGPEFEKAVRLYNSKFSPKTVGGKFNEDEINKKYIPSYFKKDKRLDMAKSDKEFRDYLNSEEYKGLLRESYFGY